MTSGADTSRLPAQTRFSARSLVAAIAATLLLAGCAAHPLRTASYKASRFDPAYGVSSSPRVVADGDPVPRGGGAYLTGRPYQIAGRSYFPQAHAEGYSAVGTASWYGDAFHGRRTANGEIFDKGSISAAHPTLPLPSYVRVTNLTNGRSMVVRVNDRGPYHGGRVMDVSQRVAETLDFRRAGTARIKVDYIGRAGLDGSDDAKLMATLRTDGAPAQLAGFGGGEPFSALASLTPSPQPDQAAAPSPARPPWRRSVDADASFSTPDHDGGAPLPPSRPFDMTATTDAGTTGRWPRHTRLQLPTLQDGPPG